MFKNLTVYRMGPGWAADLNAAMLALAKAPFVPCGATQQKSSGWVPPRGKAHAPLIESIEGRWLMQLQSEQRVVPASVVKRRTEELADRIEEATGRRPGRKQTKDLKEQALLELLPMAFTKQSSIRVCLCPQEGLLLLDSTSQAWCDEITSLLVEALPGLQLGLVHTEMSPTVAMAHWLGTGEPPYQFSVDRECELKSADEMKSVVRYARHPLDTEEVKQHILTGKMPTRLALTWRDRVSMLLTEGMQLKKLAFLDVVFEGSALGTSKVDQDEAFDANAAIAVGELLGLLPDLLEALGGEQIFDRTAAPMLPPEPGHAAPVTRAPQPVAVAGDDAPPWDV
ncbi:MAG: hypothetical protein RI907_891 [Pseudomonadota bacterium]